MAPRIPLPLVSLRRSASTAVKPSTSSVLPSSSSSSLSVVQTSATQAILRDVRAVLVAVDETVSKESPWLARLEEASRRLRKIGGEGAGELEGRASEEMEIAVYSPPLAGSKDLVTALLEDPLVPDQLREKALLERANGSAGSKSQPLKIRYGPSTMVDADGLSINSNFLQSGHFSILELPASTPPSQLFTSLLLSPLPVLVVDNLRLFSSHPPLASLLPSLLRHPRLRLVINTISELPTSQSAFEARVWTEIDHLVGGDQEVVDGLKERVFVVGAKRAVRAVDAWREGENLTGREKTEKVDFFQREFIGSNIGNLKADLVRAATTESSSSPSSSSSNPLPPSLSSTLFLAELAVSSSAFELLALSTTLKAYALAASDLRTEARSVASEFVKTALVMPPKVGDVGGLGTSPPTVAEEVLRKAKQDVDAALSRLGWLKLLGGRVDDVAWEVEDAVRSGWGGEGEKGLILSTAHLQTLHTTLSASLSNLLLHPPTPTLSSSLLVNSLPPCPPLPFPSSLLLTPLISRKNILLSPTGPIAALHLRAQKAVLTTYFSSVASVGAAYGAWLEGVWEGATGVGVGSLGLVLGVRWGMAKWEGGKRRFWRDWRRVGEGLERDLEDHLTQTARTVLLARPLAAAEGMETLVKKRREVVEEELVEVALLKERVEELQLGQVPVVVKVGEEVEQELRI
ncbi:hypothetical protein BDY24DRAFT_138669 [Mrakia frigida]|uniref:uncharacterized protein n=1 Tax=Mrakia frigida TaxID=29902 RepID=UPI003FCBF6D1